MIIRKLRRKFIFTNMCIIFLMLTAIFVSILLFTSRRVADECDRAMHILMGMDSESPFAEIRMEIGPPPEKQNPQLFSCFLVETDAQGKVSKIIGNVNVTDENALDDIVALCLSSEEESGVILDRDLRYLVAEKEQGYRIAFADRSGERRMMLSFVTTSLAVGAVSLPVSYTHLDVYKRQTRSIHRAYWWCYRNQC